MQACTPCFEDATLTSAVASGQSSKLALLQPCRPVPAARSLFEPHLALWKFAAHLSSFLPDETCLANVKRAKRPNVVQCLLWQRQSSSRQQKEEQDATTRLDDNRWPLQRCMSHALYGFGLPRPCSVENLLSVRLIQFCTCWTVTTKRGTKEYMPLLWQLRHKGLGAFTTSGLTAASPPGCRGGLSSIRVQ